MYITWNFLSIWLTKFLSIWLTWPVPYFYFSYFSSLFIIYCRSLETLVDCRDFQIAVVFGLFVWIFFNVSLTEMCYDIEPLWNSGKNKSAGVNQNFIKSQLFVVLSTWNCLPVHRMFPLLLKLDDFYWHKLVCHFTFDVTPGTQFTNRFFIVIKRLYVRV